MITRNRAIEPKLEEFVHGFGAIFYKEKGLILLMSPYASDDEIAYIVSTLNKKDI